MREAYLQNSRFERFLVFQAKSKANASIFQYNVYFEKLTLQKYNVYFIYTRDVNYKYCKKEYIHWQNQYSIHIAFQ